MDPARKRAPRLWRPRVGEGIVLPWRPQVVVGCVGTTAAGLREELAANGYAAKRALYLQQAMAWRRHPDALVLSDAPDAPVGPAIEILRDAWPHVRLIVLSQVPLPLVTRCRWYDRGVVAILEPPILPAEVFARVAGITTGMPNLKHIRRAEGIRRLTLARRRLARASSSEASPPVEPPPLPEPGPQG